MIFVEKQILAEVESLHERQRQKFEMTVELANIDPVPASAEAMSTFVRKAIERYGVAVFLISPAALTTPAFQNTKELQDLYQKGLLRIGMWNGKGAPGGFPVWGIPKFAVPGQDAITECLLQHLDHAGLPGIHSVMESKSRVYAQTISSENEIGAKLDDLFAIAYPRSGGGAGMAGRMIVNGCLFTAFEQIRAAKKQCMIKIQLGVNSSVSGFSMRWKTNRPLFSDWVASNSPWRVDVSLADAFWVHVMPESSEAEVIILFAAKSGEAGQSREGAGGFIGVDTLTNARIQGTAASRKNLSNFIPLTTLRPDQTKGPVQTAFEEKLQDERFPEKDDGVNPKPDGKAAAPLSADQHSELLKLRAENEKLSVALEHSKKMVANLNKNYSELVEAEKKSQSESLAMKRQMTELQKKEADLAKKVSFYEESKKSNFTGKKAS